MSTRLRRLLPPHGPERTLSIAVGAASLGWGAWAPASAIFYTRHAGLSAAQVGLAFSTAAGAGIAASIPAGRITDRLGAREVTLVAGVVQGTLLLCLALVDSLTSLIVVASALAVAHGVLSTAENALTAALIAGDARVRVSAYLRAVTNGGFTVGAGCAGVAIAVDTRPAYLVLMGMAAASQIVVVGIRRGLPHVERQPRSSAGALGVALRDRPFLVVTALAGFARFDSPIFNVAVPLWIVGHTEAPRSLAAWLLIVNTLMVIALQVPAARGAETLVGAGRAGRRGAFALVGACVVYGLASEVGALAATGLLFVATVLLTVGELWISASEWSLRFGLAPDDRQGEYGGVFALGRSGSDLAGPVTAVGVTDAAGLLGWLGLAGGFLVIGAVTVPIVAWAARSRQRAEPPG